MLTHTRRCLKIMLVCQICKKEYELADYAEKHINEALKGKFDVETTMEAD